MLERSFRLMQRRSVKSLIQKCETAMEISCSKPRALIKGMLIPVLKPNRQQFLNQAFPPATPLLGYGHDEIDPAVRSKVNEKHRDADTQKRLYTAIRFWGGNPDSLDQLDLPEATYEAFGLPHLSDGATPAVPVVAMPAQEAGESATQKKDTPSEPATPSKTPLPKNPPELQKWFDLFGAWAGGQPMTSNEARYLRKQIADILLSSVDWNAELLVKNESSAIQDWVYLPRSRGASQCTVEKACIVIATDADLDKDDLPVSNLLRAVVRHAHFKGWDYDESDEDYTRLANFIDQSKPRLLAWLRENYAGVKGDPAPILIQDAVDWSPLVGPRASSCKRGQCLGRCNLPD